MASEDAAPVLWHLKVSHYNEKVRWALDHKGIRHVRRAVDPGRHRSIARRLTGASTFPVLELDGRAIADSTAIIAAVERRWPEPPLHPLDGVARRRALEMEEFFDEQLGPHVRLLVVDEMLSSPDVLLGAFFPDLNGAGRRAALAVPSLVRKRFRSTLGIDDASVELAWRKLEAAGGRFRAELQPSGYLVGDAFTVADLTVAALVAPAVAPREFPYPQPQRGHRCLRALRDALAEAGLAEWAQEMYARHRGASYEVPA